MESNTGSLVLSDSLAVFDCNIASHFVEGSHTIFIGRVNDVYKREGSINMHNRLMQNLFGYKYLKQKKARICVLFLFQAQLLATL